ncbi:zinc-binding alcohol dehydrogenase family protein [Corynebacterium caspium]|uniref:zinc-binding alcohol dehydrogenase family protein n=1 Tax=Corynebacterium caspium TaxID=234828 RepID=UPI000361BE45|nr:zinc-binding alcohol dehydrogenase family protein [Corynebacterium caspium]WKD59604.1 Zinc-type alcohol dehydrogenase-like protein [Corynebacterium caspium DSM 44850]
MKAVTANPNFQEVELPDPVPGPHDILVEVRATSINPIDTKMRARGATLLGYDAVGTVLSCGELVTRFQPGERVFYAGDNARPGTNAALHVVDARIVGHAPRTLDDADAAALPLVNLTAWESLFDCLRLSVHSDGTLLVLGGAGGVPSALIQLARALTRMEIVGTASRAESHEWVLSCGAHRVVNHREDLVAQLGENSVAAAFSSWTTKREAELAAVLQPRTEFVLIDDPVDFQIAPFKAKAQGIRWESMFARPHCTDIAQLSEQGRILDKIADLADKGIIKSPRTATLSGLSAQTFKEAHRRIATASTIGKISIVY